MNYICAYCEFPLNEGLPSTTFFKEEDVCSVCGAPYGYKELKLEVKKRYKSGTSPSSKEGLLDEVDLCYYDLITENFSINSGSEGWLSGHIVRLVEEIRRLRLKNE